VQAPQDYRDAGTSAFKAMCYAEYRGFFHIGMITRNERNAIIQHGTMTMVRRAQPRAAAAGPSGASPRTRSSGLRIFEAGYEAVYIPASYGRGLMPDTFIDFKKQRFRWAYGAMQIIKAHARTLFMRAGRCPRAALSLRRRLAAVGGRRLQPAVQPGGAGVVRRHGVGAASDRTAAGHVFGAAVVAVYFQARQARASVPRARRRQRAPDVAAAIAGLALTPHHRQGGGEGPGHPRRAVFPHAKRVSASLRIEGTLSEAHQAAALADPAFDFVARGQVPVALAAQVPQHTDCPDTQVQVMQILSHHVRTPALAMH